MFAKCWVRSDGFVVVVVVVVVVAGFFVVVFWGEGVGFEGSQQFVS